MRREEEAVAEVQRRKNPDRIGRERLGAGNLNRKGMRTPTVMSTPLLQVALDLLDLPRALAIAEEAVAGGADWI